MSYICAIIESLNELITLHEMLAIGFLDISKAVLTLTPVKVGKNTHP